MPFSLKILSAGTVCGIAVDEVRVYRNIRRMPYGENRQKMLKTPGNRKTKASSQAVV